MGEQGIGNTPLGEPATAGMSVVLVRAGVCLAFLLAVNSSSSADSSETTQHKRVTSEIEQGREIFNGKGMCSSCHGVNAHRDRLPEQLTPNVRKGIQTLEPQPADLRNPAALTLATDKQRFEMIRHGRLRTSMHPLPDEVLSDEDILALLAYLESIRGNAVPPRAAAESEEVVHGEIESGRRLYHEIGGCAVCHGIEGRLKRKPSMSAELRQKLSRLQPPPADLRNPSTLKSQNDRDRFRSIKYGHPGTAMFPKNLLRDDDVWDLVAYLETLRRAPR